MGVQIENVVPGPGVLLYTCVVAEGGCGKEHTDIIHKLKLSSFDLREKSVSILMESMDKNIGILYLHIFTLLDNDEIWVGSFYVK